MASLNLYFNFTLKSSHDEAPAEFSGFSLSHVHAIIHTWGSLRRSGRFSCALFEPVGVICRDGLDDAQGVVLYKAYTQAHMYCNDLMDVASC